MDYLVTDTELTGIANAIRTKGGTSSSLVFPDGFATAIGNISTTNNQTKTNITPTESSQTIEPDSGYTGLSSVQINGISSSYVGSGVARKSSSDLTANGATVTAPAGYYSSNATKTITSGSATTPATTITANPSISINSSGVITATNSKTQSVTPTVSAGYVSSGTAGTITVDGSKTYPLSTKAGETITPTENVQIAVAAGKFTLGTVKIGAISSTYVGSGVTRLTSSDVTVSGNVVTVPVGYVAETIEQNFGETVSPTFRGGSLSFNNSSISSNHASISSSNTSGIDIRATTTSYRGDVVYDGNVSGIIGKSDGDVALSSTNASVYFTKYLTGVTLEAPSSGTRQFSITVPNGNSTVTFVFTVDSSGNVTITES